MEYLDKTGLQALWQKTKELVSAKSCVLTYPTNGETITTDTYNSIINAITDSLPIIIYSKSNNSTDCTYLCTTADNANGVLTLVWLDKTCTTKYTCTISAARKVTLTSATIGGSGTSTSSDVVYFTLPRDEDGNVLQYGTEVQELYNKLSNNIGKNKVFCYAESYTNDNTADDWKNSYPASVQVNYSGSPQIFIMYFDWATESINLYYVTNDDSDYEYYLSCMATYNLYSFNKATKSIPYVINGTNLTASGQDSYRKQVLTNIENAVTNDKPVFITVTATNATRRMLVNDIYIMKANGVVQGCSFSFRNNSASASTSVKEVFITISKAGAFTSKTLTYTVALS